MINRGLLGNSNSFIRPKRMLTEVGIQSFITRRGTDKQRRPEWLKRTTLRSWKKNFQQTIRHQYGLVWGTSPSTRQHPHSLWRINNWLTISKCFTVDLKRPDWHPAPPLICTSHIHLPPSNPLPPTILPVFNVCVEDVSLQKTEI